MKYSFILPAYKARFLKEAIDSILLQTYTDYELIIANDASPEDLYSIVKTYLNDSRIKYFVNEYNIGGKDLVSQWNKCLKYSNGEYIILASDDDAYHPNYLEKMNSLVVQYPNVSVFRPRVQIIGVNGEILAVESILGEYCSLFEFAYSWKEGWVKRGIPFYLFKKQSLIDIGGFVSFPLAWHSDDATVLSLAKNGVVSCSDLLFSFRHSGESISTKKNDVYTLRCKLNATEMFYSWYKTFLQKIEPSNYLESFYKTTIIQNIVYDRKNDSCLWVSCSSFKAILLNSIKLLENKIVTCKTLLYFLRHSI